MSGQQLRKRTAPILHFVRILDRIQFAEVGIAAPPPNGPFGVQVESKRDARSVFRASPVSGSDLAFFRSTTPLRRCGWSKDRRRLKHATDPAYRYSVITPSTAAACQAEADGPGRHVSEANDREEASVYSAASGDLSAAGADFRKWCA